MSQRVITTNINALQDRLCKSFCADIRVSKKNDYIIRIEAPFYFPDGDPYQIYLTEIGTGGFRVTDMGHTLMQLSYEHDIDSIRKGTRGSLLQSILSELDIKEDDGEFYLESTVEDIHLNIFKLGQAITKIYDLSFLSRARIVSTFYDDLKEYIYSIVDAKKIQKDYYYPNMDDAKNYKIDYKIEGNQEPLFLFGIGNQDKARLATITLERLIRHKAEFESLIVFQDFDGIPKNDSRRLMNVGGKMISSLDAKDDLAREIKKRAA